jgi:shikimate kinase
MGAGKTTVGRELATASRYRFVDTDAVISQATGKSITQLFADVGEGAFRQLESQVLAEVSAYTKLVIATGGGIVLRRENWSYLHHGLVVWLDVPVELLYARLAEDTTRPLLQDTDPLGKLRLLYEQRQPLYKQADYELLLIVKKHPNNWQIECLKKFPASLKSKAGENEASSFIFLILCNFG